MIRITVLWVLGIVLLVPYAIYRLLFVAEPDEYAFLIVFPLFWIFGFWGVVGPILAAIKAHRLIRALENAGSSEELRRAFVENEGDEFTANLNPHSLTVLKNCFVEPSLAHATPGAHYQFERIGYFCVDPDSTGEHPVFNRTVALRDSWSRQGGGEGGKS